MEPSAIRELRLRLGESRARFGARFNVSQITVGYWENGRSQPARQRLGELANLASCAVPETPTVTPFRPIQYLGSKQRLAQTIADVIEEVAPGTSRVGDLFAGSSVVSAVLGAKRSVTAVDVQAYSTALSYAILLGRTDEFSKLAGEAWLPHCIEIRTHLEKLLAPLLAFERAAEERAVKGDAEGLIQLIEFGSIAVHKQRPLAGAPAELAKLLTSAVKSLEKSKHSSSQLTAVRYFAGPYFSYRQAIALDAICASTNTLGPGTKRASKAVLLSTASEIVNTVGKQFAQPMKLMKADGHIPPLLLQRALRDRGLDAVNVFREWATRWQTHVLDGNHAHRVMQGDVIEFVRSDRECRAYYADPPYTIDHYSRFYHVLETLVLRDSPHLDEMKKRGKLAVLRGIYRAGRYQSPFCIQKDAPNAFDQLIGATRNRKAPLVMSYSPFDEEEGNRPRLLALSELVAMAKKHYPRVSVMEIDEHSHRKLNTKSANTSTRRDAERLIICEVAN